MPTTTTYVNGKTTCQKHRVYGYTLEEGVWVCWYCRKPQAHHETVEETLVRKQAEEQR